MRYCIIEHFGIAGLTTEKIREYILEKYSGSELEINEKVVRQTAADLNIPESLAFEVSPKGKTKLYRIIYDNVCAGTFTRRRRNTFNIGDYQKKVRKSEGTYFILSNIPDAIKLLETLSETIHEYEKITITAE